MKRMIARRTWQWILALAFAFTVTTIAYPRIHPYPSQQFAAARTDNLPASGDTVLQGTPSTPEQNKSAPLSKRLVEYHISVALNTDNRTLQGLETVTWTNPGKQPVRELYWHLYPNAFESKKTTFNRESGGQLRGDKAKEGSVGGMSVQSIAMEQGEDLSMLTSFVQPDDGNKDDRTLMKVVLPQPVEPGGKTTLRIGFSVAMPTVFARMGTAGDFYMAGQWFPKLAVYEPAGTRGRTEEGWNLHQYHGNSEFYADFGLYDVKIAVPEGYTVAATGFPTRPATTAKGVKTYYFYAEDVHDFAWAGSPHFVYAEEPFSTPNVPGVKIKLYLDPKHAGLKTRYMQAAKKALTRYSDWYGPYPYSTLSIVVPPADGNGAGGMEYPTLITAWGASDAQPDLDLERVVVHEIGHQYWYGMVATNEFEEAWLDEGFTSYAEDKVMERDYGVKPNLALEGSYVTSPEPLRQNAWDYGDHSQYADNVYIRGKLVLGAIERDIGEQAMGKVMRAYFQKWKFRHPSTQDFQAVLESATKKPWNDFFDQYVYGGEMVDVSVDAIQTRKLAQKDEQGRQLYESLVRFSKQGGNVASVPVRFHFSDGTTNDQTWEGDGREIQFRLTHTAPVDWAMVDPSYTMVLENRHINNFLQKDTAPALRIRLNVGVEKIVETLFGWVAW